ncbi:very-long-chain (3R)-3-hydroxyacyl-CoA dehydratase 4 isoform X2 [Salmo trutta]|uniref:very-long-chain (3R)-3-hydroxyacyl-CoA dehydratase 4 isoform X2 n=1 Tax=Salmo trutta TaxID=8032 RepID=UPI0011322A34|nr:very-long-chain (3R)-3-hydroxyacyl-CoA dehydratase 4 isoform X2 [Salmo trutta]
MREMSTSSNLGFAKAQETTSVHHLLFRPSFPGEMRLSIRLAYLFLYNLLQFCGHTWIFANMTARFLTFGGDALADTFYAVGVVMSLCQLLSVLELFHIADGIEKARLLPRYPHVLLCLMGTDSFGMLWARYTLSIPIYIMSVITEGITIHQSLPYFESLGTYSFQLSLPVSADIYFPILLKAYLPLLAVGACVTVWHSLRARELRLEKWNKKIKRK